MGKASQTLKFPTVGDIVKHNRIHIQKTKGIYAGKDNLRTPGSLKWVVDAIQYPLFGVDPYPTVEEKASISHVRSKLT